MCQHTGDVEVHHVGKLAHLRKPGEPQPPWAQLMTRMRRKTLVVCPACHNVIHGRTNRDTHAGKSLESWTAP